MHPGKKLTIKDFELLKVVGRGSFGKVYLAKKNDLQDRVFAIKVLAKDTLLKKNLLIKT